MDRNNKPIKRHTALKNLSREHHDILIFGLRLKKGIYKKADLYSINKYINWFWETYLNKHFNFEENELFARFNFLDHTDKAREFHLTIKKLIFKKSRSTDQIVELYNLIEKHIRFEERILFNEIQEISTEEQLEAFSKIHQEQLKCAFWPEQFWK